MGYDLARALLLSEMVSAEAIERALFVSVVNHVSLPRALLDTGALRQDELDDMLSRSEAPLVRAVSPLAELVARLPPGLCNRLSAVPIRRDPVTGTVDVAVADARDTHAVREIEHHLGAPVRLVRAPLAAIEEALSRKSRTMPPVASQRPHGYAMPTGFGGFASQRAPSIAGFGAPPSSGGSPPTSRGGPPPTSQAPHSPPAPAAPMAPVSPVSQRPSQRPSARPPLRDDGLNYPQPSSRGVSGMPSARGTSITPPWGTAVPSVRPRASGYADPIIESTRASAMPHDVHHFPKLPLVGPMTQPLSRPPFDPRDPRDPRNGLASSTPGAFGIPEPEDTRPALSARLPGASFGAAQSFPSSPAGSRTQIPPPFASAPPPSEPTPGTERMGASDSWAAPGMPAVERPVIASRMNVQPPLRGTQTLYYERHPTSLPHASYEVEPLPSFIPGPPPRSSRASHSPSAGGFAFADGTSVIAALRTADERDQVLDLVLLGARAVARKVAIFVVKRGGLVGWTCSLEFGDRAALQALLIPISVPSIFTTAMNEGLYLGAIRHDDVHAPVLRVMGGATRDVAVAPIRVLGKPAVVIIADDLGDTMIATRRLEEIARAAGDAFARIVKTRR